MVRSVVSKVMWGQRARTLAFCVVALLVAASIGMLLTAKDARADTISVNSMEDARDNSSTDGLCDTTRFPQPGTEPICTLRAAIEEANANGETDTIIFDPALSGTITLSLGEIGILNDTPATDLDIHGPGAGTITVSANKVSRVFYIGELTNVTISGLMIFSGAVIGSVLVGRILRSGMNEAQSGGPTREVPPSPTAAAVPR
jgi:CSLREA domain-containing protein